MVELELFFRVKVHESDFQQAVAGYACPFLLTGSSLPQIPDNRRPKSILDYYFLLPQKYLAYLTADSRPIREAAIQIKDLNGRFLKSGLATDEVSTSVSLFKKSDGSDLIAVENRACPGACSSSLSLLLYANDQWVEVTHELLPPVDESKIQACRTYES